MQRFSNTLESSTNDNTYTIILKIPTCFNTSLTLNTFTKSNLLLYNNVINLIHLVRKLKVVKESVYLHSSNLWKNKSNFLCPNYINNNQVFFFRMPDIFKIMDLYIYLGIKGFD